MSRALKITAALLLTLLLLGCASGSGTRQVASGQGLPAPDSTNDAGAYEGVSDYRLGAQDLIEVSVYHWWLGHGDRYSGDCLGHA